MSQKFGRNFPAISRPGIGGGLKRPGDRDRVTFIAAVGLAVSLLVIVTLALSFGSVDAKEVGQPALPNVAQSGPAPVGSVTLLTPEKRVASGSDLSGVVFKEVFWPRNQVPDGAIQDRNELRGMYAKMELQPGLPMQRLMLTKEPALATLPLTPGNRAVAIPVDDTAGIEGHALPGTRVDVILTYHEEGNLTSKVLVQNARVLSYGGDMTPGYQRGAAERLGKRTSPTITLDVSPKDALALQTARQLGRLSLVMRSADDEKSPAVIEQNQNDINGSGTGNRGSKTGKGTGCSRGRIKMEGKEFVVDCDGSISQLVNSADP